MRIARFRFPDQRSVKVIPSLLALLIAVQFFTEPVMASGLIRDGVGPVSAGRGGTNIGHFDNVAVLLDNPAAIVNLPGQGLFEFSIDTVITDLHYSDADPNNVHNEFRPFPDPQLGFVRKSADGRWAAGAGIFIPAGFSGEYDMFHPLFGNQEYRSLGGLAKILPGLAYRVTDDLSVGATLGAGVSHVELEGPVFLQSGGLAGTPTIFDLQADGTALTWSAGLQYRLSSETVIGLTYQSETRMRLDGELDVDALLGFLGTFQANYDASLDLVWPRSVGLGISHVVDEKQRISADVIWYDWSHAFDRLDFSLTNGTNAFLNFLTGPVVGDSLPLNWRDTVSVRLGYEYFASCCDVVRAGYVYHRRPVPEDTLNTYLDGTLEHTFALGYSKQLGEWSVNTAYQFSFGIPRSVSASRLIGGDFSNSRFTAQAHWLMLSFVRQL